MDPIAVRVTCAVQMHGVNAARRFAVGSLALRWRGKLILVDEDGHRAGQ